LETPAPAKYRFGSYEVESVSGQLLKDGRRIKLQEKPYQLLLVLLENAGQVVSRAEIQSRIWQQNTFVDFDSGLRVAVRKLRDALGDDADQPLYIDTVPKRGYSFIAPVTRIEIVDPSHAVAAQSPSPAGFATSRSSRHWMYGVAVLLLTTVVWLVIRHNLARESTAPQKPLVTLVLADFNNTTGETVFEGTLRQGLAAQLGQSPVLAVVSEERIQHVLRLMGRAPDDKLTPELASEICERTGSTAVLEGSIARLGSQYVLGLRANNCRTGDVIADEQLQASRIEDVLNTLGEMGSHMRGRLGESATMIAQHSTPLADATTPSLVALKAYSTGWRVNYIRGESAAIPFFQKAVEADPRFAMAYAALGLMYGGTGESALAEDNTRKAFQFRDRASEQERFFITASYQARVTGNLEQAAQTCETWAQTYPTDPVPHGYLSGFIYPVMAKFQPTLEQAQAAIELDPDFDVGHLNLAYGYIYLDRFSDASSALEAYASRKLQPPYFSVLRYDLAFLQHDASAMQRLASAARQQPGAEDWIADHEAFVAAYSGRLRLADELLGHAVEAAERSGQSERAALFLAGHSLWNAFAGQSESARAAASAALTRSRDREVVFGAAFALALSGDVSQTQALAADLEKRFPDDTSVRSTYLPAVRALLALQQDHPDASLESLQPAVPYELGVPRSSIHGNFGALYPVYVRGLAFLALQRAPEAVPEFEKIVAHSGIVLSDPVGAVARLQLARAYALQGNTAKARTAYQNFLELWKDADSDIPIYQQAKSEYAKLR